MSPASQRPSWSRYIGRAAGGFFLPPPDGMGLSISLQAGVAATLIDTIVWHILTYGLLLPLGACGFFPCLEAACSWPSSWPVAWAS